MPKLQANREELPTSATDDSNSALNRHEGQLEDKQSTNIDTMKTEGSSAETRIQVFCTKKLKFIFSVIVIMAFQFFR